MMPKNIVSMNCAKILPVILAGALQVMPFLRATLPVYTQGLSQSGWAIVLKLTTGAVTMLGYHAVSGATTIVGPYTINGTNGKSLSRPLGVSGQIALSWSTTTAPLGSSSFPLVPGVTLTTGGSISGTPTQTGTNTFSITAWEKTGNTGRNMSQLFTFNIKASSWPTITTPPQNITNVVGSNVTFTVVASGAPPLVYQWQFAGNKIQGAVTNSLTITNVQLTNAGTYTIIVTNASGATNNSATLTVISPPLITNALKDTIVPTGESVIFNPGIAGSPASVRWHVNANVITNATTVPLVLTNLDVSHCGIYSLVLSNIAGQASNSAHLLVVPPPAGADAPRLAPLSTSGSPFNVAFPSLAGYRYLVQFASQLGTNWETISNIPPSFSPSQVSLPVIPNLSNGFYRVVMTN